MRFPFNVAVNKPTKFQPKCTVFVITQQFSCTKLIPTKHSLKSYQINHQYKQLACRLYSTRASASGKGKDTIILDDKVPEPSIGKQLKDIMGLAKPESKKLMLAVSLLLISSGVTMSVPFSIGRVLDIVMHHLGVHATTRTELTTSALEAIPLSYLFGGLCGLFVIGALANSGRVILMRLTGEKIVMKLKSDVFANILRQDMKFFDKNRTGDLISRVSLDTTIVGKSITNNLSDGLRSFAMAGAGVGAMWFVNSNLTLIVMSIVPPIVLSAVFYGRFVRNLSTQTQDAISEATKLAEEKLGNVRTVRAFAQEDMENAKFRDRVFNIFSLARKEAYASGLFFGGTGLSGNLIILVLLYCGGEMVKDGVLSIGDLTSFFLYTAYVGTSLGGLTSFYSELMKGIGASNRLFTLLNAKPQIENSGTKKLEPLTGLIEFHDVSFSYPTRPEVQIFKNLSFKVKPGTNIAFVGESGTGKSSIAQILLRFYDPTSGRITVDGVDLKELDLNWWRESCIGLVPQEPTLFAGTVYENIAYGKKLELGTDMKVLESKVKESAAQANAKFFVEQFPNGFDTFVGEKGTSVSGGQKQRLAIARSLVKDPKILILDEATSALDSASEYLVQDALDKLVKGRTTITIAHRLSTIQKADWILMIDSEKSDGESIGASIVEQGTFHDLISRKDGKFKKLVEKQVVEDEL